MIFSLYRQFVIFSDFLIKTTIYVIETGTYIVAFVTGRLLLKTTRFTKEVFFILTSIFSRKKSTNGQADFPVGNCLFEHTSQKGSIMVITFSSMKGGVGKSTDAILLANNLAARGYKVLFFDMDTNNSSTIYYCMGIADEFPTQNVAEALTHRTTEGYTVKSRIENVDIVPSTLRLFDIRSIDYHALKKCLPTDKYDYIIIDTAPTYDNLVMNALYASDYIFTPVQLDYFNLTTSKCLRSHLYDELNEKVDNCTFTILSGRKILPCFLIPYSPSLQMYLNRNLTIFLIFSFQILLQHVSIRRQMKKFLFIPVCLAASVWL